MTRKSVCRVLLVAPAAAIVTAGLIWLLGRGGPGGTMDAGGPVKGVTSLPRPMPDRETARPGPSLRLKVEDMRDGSAIGGAVVRIVSPDERDGPARGETDATGVWIGPATPGQWYALTVAREGFLECEESILMAGGPVVERVLRMEPTCTIHGVVTARGGGPIEGAGITLKGTGEAIARTIEGAPSAGAFSLHASSAADGSYRLRGIAAGAGYEVVARKPGWVTSRERGIAVEPGESSEVDLVLVRGAIVTGRVFLASGEPAEGADLLLSRWIRGDDIALAEVGLRMRAGRTGGHDHGGGGSISEARARTDGDGRFRLEGLLAGRKWLKIAHHPPGIVAHAILEFELREGEERDVGSIPVGEGEPSFVGVVRGPGGEGVEGVTVSIAPMRPGPTTTDVVTDADGHYAVWGHETGEFVFFARTPDDFEDVKPTPSIHVGSFPYRMDFDLVEPAVLAEFVCEVSYSQDARSLRREGARTTLVLLRGGRVERCYLEVTPVERYSFRGLPPGTYHVEVSSTGGSSGDLFARSDTHDLRQGETVTVAIEPRLSAGTITGVVRDAGSGEPIEDARAIRIFSPPNDLGVLAVGAAAQSARTGPDGRFTIPGLPADEPCTLLVSGPGRGDFAIRIVLPPADLGFIDL